ncbi:aspartate/glutamate racemase family protein [Rhodoferax sp. TBRC 17660]|uniref:Aspartate/glutamate racemase family protein n=1 Tax=Rhodoferax potami TaxID=3068338 RepID=A0ABU3KNT0_9BURK|nr:aspartate/glutamate racemase family protein [Rhodoferax sp. TBRC 17660]MDT7518912.1 aspartate/glutamate racemase family protein [Rhodoferax sp. TBRC 17660]
MRRLLVINPNTTESVSTLLQHHVQRIAGPHIQVDTVTARFGAPYIACEASYAVAGHALLDAWAADQCAMPQALPDAVLIGCFGDPGLWALREGSAAPVTGLAEASFFQARRHGGFAVVTGGTKWRPMLERLAWGLGVAEHVVAIHTVAPSGVELANNPESAITLLAHACQEAAKDTSVKTVVLGGAGLAGMAAQVQPYVSLPVIDSVIAGTEYALFMPTPSASGNRFAVQWRHVSAELSALGQT